MKGIKYSLCLLALLCFTSVLHAQDDLYVGAERFLAYKYAVEGKRVAVVSNQTSRVGKQHLVDFLLGEKVNIVKVFAPEHGFRGEAAAGEKVQSGKDTKTGLPIVSLYGSNKKPTPEQLANVEVVLFDIQDVGARFYTYISTMTYVMEACAEKGIPFLVLDRPNPNGFYVDGPVLQKGFESFVGLHPVPVVHGMTIGEYALMVSNEGWLAKGKKADLTVIKCLNYSHKDKYVLPVAPSPNLPNAAAVALYPSLCFFEGTPMSVGRGTDFPFQTFGAPWFHLGSFVFTPHSMPSAPHPPYENQDCFGINLRNFGEYFMSGSGELYWFWLVEAYKLSPDKEKFFTPFFDKLTGTDKIRKAIIGGMEGDEIPSLYKKEVEEFKKIRDKYLIYPDE